MNTNSGFIVHVLYAPVYDGLYIGYTTKLEQRLLIYQESILSKSEAMKREKQLKSEQGIQ